MLSGGIMFAKLIIPAILTCFIGYSNAQGWQEFNMNSQQFIAEVDNTNVVIVSPIVLEKRVTLFDRFGNDFDKHAVWHMDVIESYLSLKRKSENRHVANVEEVILAVKLLTMLSAGVNPIINRDNVFWAKKSIISVMKYGKDEDARGYAALSLGILASKKSTSYNKEIVDSLGFTVLYDAEEFAVKRIAVMSLAAIGQKYAISKLSSCAMQLAQSHDFFGRQKFRYGDDESSWSLEVAILRGLESNIKNPATKQLAVSQLKYFANLTHRTCGNFTVVKLPDDKKIDETLLINARLILAENGFLFSNRDQPETGSAKCLLPIANNGDTCELRQKAAKLFRQIHGDVIYATGSYIEGGGNCLELQTRKVMTNIALVFLTDFGLGLIIKSAISSGVKGVIVISKMNNARKMAQYTKMGKTLTQYTKGGKRLFKVYETASKGPTYVDYYHAAEGVK